MMAGFEYFLDFLHKTYLRTSNLNVDGAIVEGGLVEVRPIQVTDIAQPSLLTSVELVKIFLVHRSLFQDVVLPEMVVLAGIQWKLQYFILTLEHFILTFASSYQVAFAHAVLTLVHLVLTFILRVYEMLLVLLLSYYLTFQFQDLLVFLLYQFILLSNLMPQILALLFLHARYQLHVPRVINFLEFQLLGQGVDLLACFF